MCTPRKSEPGLIFFAYNGKLLYQQYLDVWN